MHGPGGAGSTAVADDEGGEEHFADGGRLGKTGVAGLDEGEERPNGDLARLAERLLDARHRWVEEVQEGVVVKGDDPDVGPDPQPQAPQGVDHAEEYGGAESEHRVEGQAGPAGWGAG